MPGNRIKDGLWKILLGQCKTFGLWMRGQQCQRQGTSLCHFKQSGLERASEGFYRDGGGQSTGLLCPFQHHQVQTLLWVGKILLSTSTTFVIKPQAKTTTHILL